MNPLLLLVLVQLLLLHGLMIYHSGWWLGRVLWHYNPLGGWPRRSTSSSNNSSRSPCCPRGLYREKCWLVVGGGMLDRHCLLLLLLGRSNGRKPRRWRRGRGRSNDDRGPCTRSSSIRNGLGLRSGRDRYHCLGCYVSYRGWLRESRGRRGRKLRLLGVLRHGLRCGTRNESRATRPGGRR